MKQAIKKIFTAKAKLPHRRDVLKFYRAAIDGDLDGIDAFVEKYGREHIDIQMSGKANGGD